MRQNDNETGHPCDHEDCTQSGIYPAPKPGRQAGYHWFCLEHVRVYNKQWNYFSGMSSAEIENHRRRDMFGHRPVWPMGGYKAPSMDDPSKIFENDPFERYHAKRSQESFAHSADYIWALGIFNLPGTSDLAQIKACYKTLVKRYHPDITGGDKGAEERLKNINQAYKILRQEC